MKRLFAIIAFVLCFDATSGCIQRQPSARKEIQVPDGGPPVLTASERLARNIPLQPREPALISQASYTRSVEALPLTLRPLEKWTDQDAAEHALGRIGAAAVPALVDALRSPDPTVRIKAVEVLGRMGDEAAAAVPALIPLLDDPDLAVRKSTARTLGQIGPAARDAVPALMRNLFQPPASPPHLGSPVSP